MKRKFSKRKRGRVHGFLARSLTVGGRRVLRRRRLKGRKQVSVSTRSGIIHL